MRPSTPHYNWNVWSIEDEPLESFSGYLPTFVYDPADDLCSFAIEVSDLRPGDPDPRWPSWFVRSIHRLTDSDVHYLILEPSDPSVGSEHPAGWMEGWPLAAPNLERVADINQNTIGYFSIPGITLPPRPGIRIHDAEEILGPGCVSPWAPQHA